MGTVAVLGGIVLAVVLLRFFGAWMLRIDVLISNQEKQMQIEKEILRVLKELNKKEDAGA